MNYSNTSARHRLAAVALGGVAIWLLGCQGADSPASHGVSPTEQSRAAIREQVSKNFTALSQSGLPLSQNAAFNSPLAAGVTGGVAGGAGGTSMVRPVLPMIGSFLNNAYSPRGRGAHLRTRDETLFYYDEYMGRWIETISTNTSYTYAVYLDEQKQHRVGLMESTWTGDPSVFPQVYHTTYDFNDEWWIARGTYDSIYNEDGSGSMTYDSEYSGYHDRGTSVYNADGSSSWSSRTDGPDGYFTTSEGHFDGLGNGMTLTTSSDGWRYEYHYNADGSGSARIEGPADGLPMDITWDSTGRTTIRYADGTTETYDYFWGWCGGGIIAGGGGGGSTGGGSTGGGEGSVGGGEGGGDPSNGRAVRH